MILTEQVKGKGFDGIKNNPSASLLYGAQQGYTPILGGKALDGSIIEEWASNTAFVTTDIIAIPLNTPKFFQEFDAVQAKYLKKVWIDMFSILPTSIEGLDSTLTVENDTVEYGASGSLIMKEYTRIIKAETNLVYNYVERQGLPINEFLEFLIRYGVGNEYTQVPEIASVQGVRAKFKGKTRLQDYYTGTILFLELDKMHSNVNKAWYSVAVRPDSGGEVIGKRDLATAKEITRYSIPMSSMTDSNAAIKAFGQIVFDKMTIFNLNASISTIVPVGVDEVNIHTADVGDDITDHNGIHVSGFETPEQLDSESITDAYV